MRRAFILVAVLAAGLAVAGGCVEKIAENRVRTALVGAGLSQANTDCMAHRMVGRLTVAQLRKLEALQGEKRSTADYVEAVARVGDAKVLGVTASSAALCAAGLGR